MRRASGIHKAKKKHLAVLFCRSAEVSLEKTCESLAVAGFVAVNQCVLRLIDYYVFSLVFDFLCTKKTTKDIINKTSVNTNPIIQA